MAELDRGKAAWHDHQRMMRFATACAGQVGDSRIYRVRTGSACNSRKITHLSRGSSSKG